MSVIRLEMDQCFELLHYAISQEVEEVKTKVYPYDPLKELADRLYDRLVACKWSVDEAAIAHSVASITVPNVPSTSDANKTECLPTVDSRIRYSAMLDLILNKLSTTVKRIAKECADQMNVLSCQQITLLTNALNFYIPTAIIPYLDQGVGFGVEQRSKMVKYWQPLRDDDNFRREQLLNAAKTMNALSKCCTQAKELVATRFIADLIALNEQLLHMNESTMKQSYEMFLLKDVRRPDLMYQFFVLMNPLSASRSKIPSSGWFTMALGRRLSEMVIGSDGIANLTTALTQEGDKSFENALFVQSLADVISKRPQFLKKGDPRRTLYHANILKQFIAVMQRHPSAQKITAWFAASVEAIAVVVPRTVAICFTDSLLHSWEVLLEHNNDKRFLWKDGWTKRLDDSLKVLLLYVQGLSPAVSMQGIQRMKKLFPLWLSLFGSSLHALEQITSSEYRSKCDSFISALQRLLERIVQDPVFESDQQRAKFLLGQLTADDIRMRVEFNTPAAGLITELGMESVNEQRLNYDFVHIYGIASINDDQQLTKARLFDNLLKAIIYLLQSIRKNSKSCAFTLNVLSECVMISRGCTDRDDEAFADDNDSDRFMAIQQDDRSSDPVTNRMRVEYLMGSLGELLAELDVQSESEEILSCVAGVAQVIIESTNRKLEAAIECELHFDVRKEDKQESEMNEARAKSMDMAVALAGAVIIAASASSDKVKSSLSSLGSNMGRFCELLNRSSEENRAQFSTAFESAQKMIDVLKCVGIAVRESSSSAFPTANDTSGAKNSKVLRESKKNTSKLDAILEEIDDAAEAIRGHALIELAKGIRKRDGELLKAVERNDQIMKIVMKKVTDSDSYVYLTAINAMAELAYWKREYFEAMLEFFVDPHGKLIAIIDEMECCEQMKSNEKEDFLLVQRVKIAEAFGKVCRALGDMAPWHFDRLIDPLLSLIMHAEDEQLKSSCVCTIADLVIACKGRKISKHLNEMLLLIEKLLSSAEQSLLRRAAVVLLRSIIVSFDTAVLEGLQSHLRDLHRHLRHLLVMDSDDGVRLLAELCLLDIKEQMDNAVNDLQNSMVKRIRIV
ncbi:unnamed protein product [Anisakis simplex]|uniref:RTP1_C1 domain-containing protein n=1 Tax=Anisakis simplex TaxID=6269 RepID=A0A0M3JYB8_ANISI|nr:unnamed protein product [Anisakis simplex]